MKKTGYVLGLILLLAAIGYTGYSLFKPADKNEETQIIKTEESAQETEKTDASLPVKVIEIKRGKLPLRLKISATADVWEKAVIRAEVSGKIKAIHVPIGAVVKKQQELLKIDDSEIRLEVDEAKTAKLKSLANYLVKEQSGFFKMEAISKEVLAELETMKDKYKAALEKYENNEINETQFNLTKDQYDRLLVKSGFLRDEIRMAQENLSENVIRLKQAELKLQKTSIISPFPGIVAELKASPGEIISAGTEVIKVVNLKSIYLKGFALESELVNLKTGINVRIKFDSFPNRYFSGVLDAVSPEVDAEKKLITVYVKVANPDNMILPGMHAEIDVEYEVFDNVLKVPRQAIVMRGQGDRPTIFVIKDSIALWKYVELGAKNDEEQIVTGEIEEGDLVVIDGHMTLGHQSKVTITETVQ